MTSFITKGNTVFFSQEKNISIKPILEAKTYNVHITPQNEFYLQETFNTIVPSKIYGDSVFQRSDRIPNTFKDRTKSTGVLLVGNKGSGKTLLTKVLSKTALENGMPVVIIDEPFSGGKFNEFISNITTSCVIIFDEFEKAFKNNNSIDDADHTNNDSILNLLDGLVESKHLYLLVTNSILLSPYLLNRPGRIFYVFTYTSLDNQIIESYVNETLKNKNHIDDLLHNLKFFSELNFDMLSAIVEEMNRYNETSSVVCKLINASTKFENNYYDVKMFINDVLVDKSEMNEISYGNPLSYDHKQTVKCYETTTHRQYKIDCCSDNFVSFGDTNGSFIFEKLVEGLKNSIDGENFDVDIKTTSALVRVVFEKQKINSNAF